MSELAYDIPKRVDPNDILIDFVIYHRAALDVGLLVKNVSTDLPGTGLVGNLPFVLVGGFGGDTDRFGGVYDAEVSVFADTYAKARNLALGLEARLLGYPFRVSSGGRSVLVDSVAVPVPFTEVEWQKDSPIRRFQGTIQISIRR
jgi:hypothetical protein